eukprot:TRINITY_DN6252_c0_g2_i1.p1 TRINITY_DN6252_c0_g2~~TRINITY_DN6252_c0_g2_i1.p1  ORF type:complete len:429 (-),score=62.16 TRINITY_DN6252_c0_g2_i1:63-1349(-)
MKLYFVLMILVCSSSVQSGIVLNGKAYETVSTEFWNSSLRTFAVPEFAYKNVSLKIFNEDTIRNGMEDYVGSVVLVETFYYSDEVSRYLKSEGALVAILKVERLGRAGIEMAYPREEVGIPTLEIISDDFYEIKSLVSKSEENFYLTTISDSEPASSFLDRLYIEAAFMNIFFGIFYVVVFFIILYNFVLEIRDVGPELSLKFLIGLFLVILNFIRLAFLIYDPLTYYRSMGAKLLGAFYITHLFASVLGTVMITVYWFEFVNRGIMALRILKKISLPYYALLALFFVGVLVLLIILVIDVTGGFYVTYMLTFFIILCIAFVMLSVIQLIAAFAITSRQRKIENQTQREHKAVIFAVKIAISSALQIFLIPLYLSSSMVDDDILSTMLISLLWFFAGIESLIILSLIEWGKSNSKTGTSTDHKSQTNV